MSGDLKPLEWRKVGTFLWTAVGAGWSFHVYEHPEWHDFTATGPGGEIGGFGRLELAMQACEADYARRVAALFERVHA